MEGGLNSPPVRAHRCLCGDGVWVDYSLDLEATLPVLFYFCAAQLSPATAIVQERCDGAPHQCTFDSATPCLLAAHLPPAATYVRLFLILPLSQKKAPPDRRCRRHIAAHVIPNARAPHAPRECAQ